MKNNYPLLLSATIAVIILLLLISCGTRKTSQQKTTFKSDSLSIENTRILKQNIELRDIYSIKPFDVLKPMIIDGKEYLNASIVFDNSEIKEFQIEQKKLSVDVSKKSVEKVKEIEKSDTSNLWIGIAFVIGLFVFLWFYLPRIRT